MARAQGYGDQLLQKTSSSERCGQGTQYTFRIQAVPVSTPAGNSGMSPVAICIGSSGIAIENKRNLLCEIKILFTIFYFLDLTCDLVGATGPERFWRNRNRKIPTARARRNWIRSFQQNRNRKIPMEPESEDSCRTWRFRGNWKNSTEPDRSNGNETIWFPWDRKIPTGPEPKDSNRTSHLECHFRHAREIHTHVQ